jgi:pyridoxamine 5'-phosphate oxidase
MTDKQSDIGADLHGHRTEYRKAELQRSALQDNPLQMFSQWLQDAQDTGMKDATAMTLATANPNGAPSARIVLLKQFDDSGFCWYTGYESRKGHELAQNPQAALLFFWPALERQVRLEGTVDRVPAAQSDAYFKSRPKGSRYSAAASPQSQVVESQAWLASQITALKASTPADQLERPEQWGGYRLQPKVYEFWQGRPSRSHDRFRYQRINNGWQIDRLAP